jgi:hypothetical protein
MWQQNFVAVHVYLHSINVEFDEVSGAETCCDGNIGLNQGQIEDVF